MRPRSTTSKSKLPKTRTPDFCYVYCAAEGDLPQLPAAGIIEGSTPRIVRLDGAVALIVSDVPATTYAPDALEPRLADLDWVASAGERHHQVIDRLAEGGATVLPFRLFTLFSGEDVAVATLAQRREAMTRTFNRVRGKQEWVLRIGKPDAAKAAVEATAITTRESGTSFLQAKADAKRQSAARATRVKEDAAAAYEALEQLADAAKTRAVEGNLILDAAFLVPPSRLDAMREILTRRAERLLRDGCPVSLTGPWPPYSFASMDPTDG